MIYYNIFYIVNDLLSRGFCKNYIKFSEFFKFGIRNSECVIICIADICRVMLSQQMFTLILQGYRFVQSMVSVRSAKPWQLQHINSSKTRTQKQPSLSKATAVIFILFPHIIWIIKTFDNGISRSISIFTQIPLYIKKALQMQGFFRYFLSVLIYSSCGKYPTLVQLPIIQHLETALQIITISRYSGYLLTNILFVTYIICDI